MEGLAATGPSLGMGHVDADAGKEEELVNTHDLEMSQLEGSRKIYAQGDDYHEYFKRSFEEDIAAQVPQGVEW
uniref:Uncharacterized protein n=1 Tax=Zea mays TaxID=4577 RepID=A0A804MMM4_MAIZE